MLREETFDLSAELGFLIRDQQLRPKPDAKNWKGDVVFNSAYGRLDSLTDTRFVMLGPKDDPAYGTCSTKSAFVPTVSIGDLAGKSICAFATGGSVALISVPDSYDGFGNDPIPMTVTVWAGE
ncbi:hypothetical protein ACN20G_35005 (plasmid) [Streptomyces sp. BI20]|uniref:hypothetical protein n=1 Tax=Streptomyces sp. BI20 TaxID=3403460 RepID=UPI003C774B35